MTAPEAHGLLREQIADVLLLHGGLGSWMPGQIDVVLDDLVVFVEAAIAAAEMKFADEVHAQHREALAVARRDALTAAADEMFAEVEGGPGLLRPEVQAWLRQRAAEVLATPEEPPPAEVCRCVEYDDGWMDCRVHPTTHPLRMNGTRTLCPHKNDAAATVNDDWICSACGSDVMFEQRGGHR